MIESFSDICLLAGNSNKALAQEIADNLALPLCSAKIGKFSDGCLLYTSFFVLFFLYL